MGNFFKFLYEHIKIIRKLLVGMIFISSSYFFLTFYWAAIPYLSITKYHIIIILLIPSLVYLILFEHYQNKNIDLQESIFIFWVFIIIFFQLFYHTYTNEPYIQYQTIQKIQPLLLTIQYALWVIIVLIILVFPKKYAFHFSNLYSNIWEQIIESKNNDLLNEAQRLEKITTGDNKSIQYLIIKNIYREGPTNISLLVFFILAGLFLRLWNLDALPPVTDEYSHIFTAQALINGTSIETVYSRSLYIITLPVYWSFKLFGVSLWSARFVSVIGNLLAMIPLYLLCRRLNKKFALLTVGFYAVNPWSIFMAKFIREYSIQTFFMLLATLLVIQAWENLDKVINKKIKLINLLSPSNLFIILGTIAWIYYILIIDPSSTTKITGVIYIGFIAILIIYALFPKNKLICISLLSIMAWGTYEFLQKYMGHHLSTSLTVINDDYWKLFLNSPQQWFSNRNYLIGLFPFILAVVLAYPKKKFGYIVLFSLINFLSLIFFFTFILDRYYSAHYSYIAEIWFLIIISFGIYAFIEYFRIFIKDRRFIYLFAGIMVWGFINWTPLIATLNLSLSETIKHPVTQLYYYDTEPAYQYLSGYNTGEDVLISTNVLLNLILFRNELTFESTIRYNPARHDINVIFQAIEKNKSGWIVLDINRGSKWQNPIALEDFTHSEKQVDYLGLIGDQFIFHWGSEP